MNVTRTLVVASSPFDVGPILFVLYAADIAALVKKCGLVPHLYADDT